MFILYILMKFHAVSSVTTINWKSTALDQPQCCHMHATISLPLFTK
jgi:hypothetical protein